MTESSETVPVVILGKEYVVRCSPEERPRLERVAQYLDERMKETRDSGAAVGTDRVAVLTALNVANELFALQERLEQGETGGEAEARVERMLETVQNLLDEERGESRSARASAGTGSDPGQPS